MNQKTRYNDIHPGMTFRIGNHMLLTGQLDFAWNKDELQYVSTFTSPDDDRDRTYIMGFMDQKTYGFTLNLQLNLTPDLSIQYYGSPFTSVARYNQFKRSEQTLSRTFENRFSYFEENRIHLENGIYVVEEMDQVLSFPNPDFSFNEFRSNLVARWEYSPGSTIYLVWEHQRSGRENIFQPGWGNNMGHMSRFPAGNTIMMKVNY